MYGHSTLNLGTFMPAWALGSAETQNVQPSVKACEMPPQSSLQFLLIYQGAAEERGRDGQYQVSMQLIVGLRFFPHSSSDLGT